MMKIKWINIEKCEIKCEFRICYNSLFTFGNKRAIMKTIVSEQKFRTFE